MRASVKMQLDTQINGSELILARQNRMETLRAPLHRAQCDIEIHAKGKGREQRRYI